jgi:hypothetical protein
MDRAIAIAIAIARVESRYLDGVRGCGRVPVRVHGLRQVYVLLGAVGVPRRCLRGVRGRGRGPEVHRQGVDVL